MLLGVLGHLPARGTQGPYPPSFGPDPACPPPAFGEFSFVTRGRWRACEGLGGGLGRVPVTDSLCQASMPVRERQIPSCRSQVIATVEGGAELRTAKAMRSC